ncbi:MAG: glycosyltransferase family 4 protein [Candidatus Aminicenantes bacterium]
MKILFTNTGPWGTGSATVVDALSREMLSMGHEIKIFFPDSGFDSMDMKKYYGNPEIYEIWDFPVEKNGTRLYTFPLIIPDPHPRNYHHAWTFKDLSKEQLNLYMNEFKKRMKKILKNFQPDVIECQHIWTMGYAVNELGRPYLSAAHHSDQLGYKRDERMRPFADEASQNSEYILAISKHVREEVLELYPVSPQKVLVTGNGYDQKTFYPRDENRKSLLAEFRLDIPDDAPIVTFTGKISKTKGVDIFLMANKIIQKECEVHFLVFGVGELEDVMDEENRKRYSRKNIHILGHQLFEYLARFHRIARLSILPSRYEGFGIAALEAMGCGTPLVVTKTGGPDTFAVGKVVEKENPGQLAGAVLELLSLNDKEMRRLSQRAHQQAKKYSWKSIAEDRLALYRKVRFSGSTEY